MAKAMEVTVDFITTEEVRAIVLMMLITHGGTEWIKRVARSRRWFVDSWSPRTLAFITGFGSAMAVWPHASTLLPWQVGLGMGFGYPALYWIILSMMRAKWPDAADKISGGHRKMSGNSG